MHNTSARDYKPPVDQASSSSYPACQTYYLAELEAALVQTKLFQAAKAVKLRALVGDANGFGGTYGVVPSDPLGIGREPGSYCTWFNRQVACQQLTFNEKPVPPFC